MPKRYARKRVARRRRPYLKRRPRKNLKIGGFPTRMLVKLKYSQMVQLNPTVGGVAVHVFRANSVYDPDFTGVGHQPSNFDRFALNYDRYTVLGSRCTIYYNKAESSSAGGQLFCKVSQDGGDLLTAHAAGGVSNMIEQPSIRYTRYPAGINTGFNKPIIMNFSTKRFFGTKNIVGVSPYSADVAGNPTEGAFFEVGLASYDDTIDPPTMPVRVEIEYIVLFTEPKVADSS